MTSNYVNTSLLGNYKINDVEVEINFTPRVIEVLASNDEINVINNLKIGEKFDVYPLEKHFDNIFKIIKSRVLKFKTYLMFVDTIEYLDHELKWRSNFNEKEKLMHVQIIYSEMNSLDYQQDLANAIQEFSNAEERGEDMDEWIESQFQEKKTFH